jgi:pimeloyl-ACP methyl ester carboxylesterase
LPDAELHVLGGVGHLIHYERPREAAELIVSFLGVGAVAAR